MTISSTTNKVIYSGDGTSVSFAYTYRMDNDSDMEVYLEDIQQGTGYTVNRAPDNIGGTVVFGIAPGVLTIVTLLRVIPQTQETDYVPYDAFPAEAHEDALDKLTMEVQQIQEQVDRNTQGIGVDIGDTITNAPPYDAGKAYKWSTTEQILINSTYDPDISVGQADQFAQEAAASAQSASLDADAAEISATNSYDWSSTPEDIPVDDGVYNGFSAFHWAKKAEDAAAAGESNTASNLSATGIYASKTGVNLNFKGITVSGGLGISNTANTVIIDFPDASVTNAKMAVNSVSTVQIVNNSVASEKIPSNAITSAKIAPDAVTANELANNSVSAVNIIDGQVSQAKLASSSVSTIKILDSAVTEPKLDVNALQVAGLLPTAWARYVTAAGTVAPAAGLNIASITRDSTGNSTVTFTTAMSNTNYSVVATLNGDNSDGDINVNSRTTTGFSVRTGTFGIGIPNTLDNYSYDIHVFGGRD